MKLYHWSPCNLLTADLRPRKDKYRELSYLRCDTLFPPSDPCGNVLAPERAWREMVKSPRILRFILIFILVIIFLFSGIAYYGPPISSISPSKLLHTKPANGTLGFGGLYVVSGPGSVRRYHLEEAAAVTELNLTIPNQVEWSEQDISQFRVRNESESHVSVGSIKAWLSHHLVLRAFLDSGQETALIFEDDVDWDIRLRSQQAPLTQQATRQLLEIHGGDSKSHPWGNLSEWDLLYLGHCGDYFNPLDEGVGVGHHHPEHLHNIPHVIFPDDSVSPFTNLHPFTASLFSALSIPEQHRVIHASRFPLCSFGYAVTRRGAELILDQVAPAKEELTRGVRAYDVALLDGCTRHGVLRCYTVQPELFHHMEGISIISTIDDNGFRPPVDVKGFEQVQYRRETSNIDCGFFWGEFYYDGNMEKLEWLREEAGRKGQCLKPGRF